jgi:glycosyltransferase involved in cell wall biosynthesis
VASVNHTARLGVRIAMLTTFYPPYHFGGDAIGVQRLATALAERGCEVTVIHDEDAYMLRAGIEPARQPSVAGVEVIGLRSRLGAVSSLLTHQFGRPIVHGAHLRQILSPGAFDVIWYHNVSLVGGPGLLAYGDGLKVYEAHEHWLVCPTHVLWRYGKELCDAKHCLSCTLSYRRPPQAWRYTKMLERELDHVDAFIAKSEFSRDMHRAFGFPRPMEVIPYFLADVPHDVSNAEPATEEAPYFLFVGRLEKIKGVQDIMPAFTAAEGPNLLIIGAGEFETELRRLAADKPRVRFLGRLPPERLSHYYAGALALIVPSICYETFGIILIESFRNATPVIARRIGPFPEIVGRGGGVLFSTDDELGAAIARFHNDMSYRMQLSRQARTAFETYWRDDVVVASYLDLLRRIALAKGNARVVSALERMQ